MCQIIRTRTVDGMSRFAVIDPQGVQVRERFFTATAAQVYADDHRWIVRQR